MGPTVALTLGAVAVAPSGKNFHAVGTAPVAATALGSIVTIPSWQNTQNGEVVYPKSVSLAVTTGATGVVRVTFDGQTTPSATLGLMVPTEPNLVYIPCPDAIAGNTVRLYATIETTVQVLFEA